VVLAAGTGSRIRVDGSDEAKPLQRVAGVTLLKRTLLTLAAVGVRKVFLVVGFRKEQIASAVRSDDDLARAGLEVELVDNPAYEKQNGISVLLGGRRAAGPFLLSMCDHVYEPAVAARAAAADLAIADLHLCVDLRLAEIYDMPDCTKVRTEAGRIIDIGKTIPVYDAVDCGVFAVAPRLLDCLAEVEQQRGDCSLSEGVKRLAAEGRARPLDIGDAFWQDVDTPEARERAEGIIKAGRAPGGASVRLLPDA
jgi:choline kinase